MSTPLPPDRCGCVVLAGGASRRLGTPKQLLRIDGQTLIRRAVCLAMEAGCSPVVAVLGANAEEILAELKDLSIFTVFNADWQTGMSTSLVAGLSGMVAYDSECSHVLITVCDQVHVTVETLRTLRLRASANPAKIVAASYSGVTGVPAIFPRAFFSGLLAIRGDKGARGLLQELISDVESVEFPGGALDIDTLEDAKRAGLTDQIAEPARRP